MDATTLGQSGPGSDGNEKVLHILKSSSTTGASLSDCLMAYLVDGVLPFYRDAVGVLYSPSRLSFCVEEGKEFNRPSNLDLTEVKCSIWTPFY